MILKQQLSKVLQIGKIMASVAESFPSRFVRLCINRAHNCNFMPAEQLIDDLGLKGNAVSGYVPYFRSGTKVVIYNFFGRNYGIRSSIPGFLVFSKRGSVSERTVFSLDPDEILEIDCPDLDADTVLVYLVSPRIRYNHGRSLGHLRFFGVYGDCGAVTHSMPTQGIFYLNKHKFVDKRRRLTTKGVSLRNTCKHFTINNCLEFNLERPAEILNRRTPLGFWSIAEGVSNEALKPTGLWHGGSFYANEPNDVFITQAIPVPSQIQISDIICSFDEFCIDAVEIELIFCRFCELGSEVIDRANLTVTPDKILNLEQLVENWNEIDFVCLNCISGQEFVISYINFIYVTRSGAQDGMHAHVINPPVISECGVADFKVAKSSTRPRSNALKFFYNPIISADCGFEMHVFIRRDRVKFKVRFIGRDGSEQVLLEEHDAGCVSFCSNSLELPVIPVVVQLESFDENIDATYLLYNRTKAAIACDHLTGG